MYDRGDSMAIAADGLLCQSRDQQGWHGTRCTKGVAGKGKYYFEATVTDDGLCRVGWSTLKASLDLGTDRQGFGYGGTGKKSFGKQFDNYGEVNAQKCAEIVQVVQMDFSLMLLAIRSAVIWIWIEWK